MSLENILGKRKRRMGSKVTALFMALLIGNPMCCCVTATFFDADHDKELAVQDQSCCCQLAEQSDQEEKPDEPDSCSCSLKKAKSLTLTQALLLKVTGDDQITKALLQTDCSLTLPHLSPVVQHLSKWPPGSLPAPSLRRRIALQCCYRLWFVGLEASPVRLAELFDASDFSSRPHRHS